MPLSGTPFSGYTAIISSINLVIFVLASYDHFFTLLFPLLYHILSIRQSTRVNSLKRLDITIQRVYNEAGSNHRRKHDKKAITVRAILSRIVRSHRPGDRTSKIGFAENQGVGEETWNRPRYSKRSLIAPASAPPTWHSWCIRSAIIPGSLIICRNSKALVIWYTRTATKSTHTKT